MKYLIIDGMNFFHRARAGFSGGPHPLMFNFFRNLRAQVEFHKPQRVFFVLEGHPKHRHATMPDYKANRVIQETDPDFTRKIDEMSRFFEGHNDVLELMMKCFPIMVAKHPDYECDDVIHNIVKAICEDPADDGISSDEAVVVSSDTDFIQLLQRFENVELYNAMKKEFVQAPPYDYVTWKALRGDPTDNIPGVKRVGDRTATNLMQKTRPELDAYLARIPGTTEVFQRNIGLIRFADFSDEDLEGMVTHFGHADWPEVKRVFDSYGFKSITNDRSWERFVTTFDALV